MNDDPQNLSLFNKDEAEKILKIKFQLAEILLKSMPPFLLDDHFGYTKSWCIAGGWFSALYNKHLETSDIDVFIFSHQYEIHRSLKLYLKTQDSNFIENAPNINEGYGRVSSILNSKIEGQNIQFIICQLVIKTPDDVTKDFDLVHCQPHYFNNTLYISKQQYDAVVNKKLILNKDKVKPERLTKWHYRGYQGQFS